MHAHVLVTLLETIVLLHEMQEVTTNHDRSLHLHLAHDTGENSATDRDHAGEWALLVDVVSYDSLFGCLEAESNIAVESRRLLSLARELWVAVEIDSLLLLESAFNLRGGKR